MKLTIWLGATIILTVASIFLFTTRTESDPPGQVALDGESVFRAKGCSGCHSAPGVTSPTQVGPDLSGLADRAADRVEGLNAEGYVRQSVLAPQAFIVPGYGSIEMPTLNLSELEIEALLTFLLDR